MLTRLNKLIDDCSQTAWKFLIVFVGFGGCLTALQRMTGLFPEVAEGNVPFDMQNTLTTEQVFAQLGTWSVEAFDLYRIFQFVDFFFPLLGGLMLGAIFAFSLRTLSPNAYVWVRDRNLLLLFLVPTVFDWLENVGFVSVVAAWPDQADAFAAFAIAAKYGKLGTLLITQPTALLLLVVALVKRGIDLLKRLVGRA